MYIEWKTSKSLYTFSLWIWSKWTNKAGNLKLYCFQVFKLRSSPILSYHLVHIFTGRTMLSKLPIAVFATSLLILPFASAADRWPAAWCDKECIETCLFAQGCINSELPCRCSSHFQTKLNKCKSDGCDENYVNKNWSQTVEPLLDDCTGKYYDGPI